VVSRIQSQDSRTHLSLSLFSCARAALAAFASAASPTWKVETYLTIAEFPVFHQRSGQFLHALANDGTDALALGAGKRHKHFDRIPAGVEITPLLTEFLRTELFPGDLDLCPLLNGCSPFWSWKS
jgi:hypothetical protein